MRKMIFRENRRGTFLLEALLAVFILSFALVGLIRGLLASLNAAVEAEKYSQAILLAENAVLEMIRLNGQQIFGPIDSDSEGRNLTTIIKTINTPDLKGVPDLHHVRLSVVWPGKVKDKEIDADTLIFGPPDETN